jgi:hypothetical protein
MGMQRKDCAGANLQNATEQSGTDHISLSKRKNINGPPRFKA